LAREARRGNWSADLEEEFNEIDEKQRAIRTRAEKEVRKLRMGQVEWSPRLQKFRTAIELWSLILLKRKGVSASNRKIARLAKKAGVENANELTQQQVQEKVDLAFKQYKEAKKQSGVWRNEFLEELAKNRAERKGTEVDSELRDMRRIEMQRTEARNIKRMRGVLLRTAMQSIFFSQGFQEVIPTERRYRRSMHGGERISI
jgi:hypothetical protein